MISKTLQEGINAQINKEFYSAYLYLGMAAWFENKNLGGFAQWLKVQEGEERSHAMKFYDHLVARGGKVELKTITAPMARWETNLAVFREVYAHEVAVTASINKLYELAINEKDYASQILIQWFISEQVEEEKHAAEIVAQLELIEERGTAVLMLDHQLAKRGK